MEDTALLQSTERLSSQTLPGGYSRLLLRAPPGLAIGPGQYLSGWFSKVNRPVCLPVMGVNAGVFECLYRHRGIEDFPDNAGRSMMVTAGGNAWHLDNDASEIVFLARNEGLACIVHAVSRLRLGNPRRTLTAFLEFDGDPPFTPKPSQILLPGAPAEALACVPLLEDWGVASRLADPNECRIPKPGWFSGTAVSLAETWLEKTAAGHCRLACCGPQHFVDTVLTLADRRRLPVESTVLPASGRPVENPI
jgi:hypothetical protein